MVLGNSLKISPPNHVDVHRQDQPVVDPRYQEWDFRKTQAQRWLNFFLLPDQQLTAEEHYLIPHRCHQEIKEIIQEDKKIQREKDKTESWNKLSKLEQNLCRIWQVAERVLNPIFSITDSSTGTWSTVKFYGMHIITLGALFTSAYTGDNQFIIVASVGYFVYLSREIYLKNFSHKGV